MTLKKHTWFDDPIHASTVISDDFDREMQPIAVEAILNKTVGASGSREGTTLVTFDEMFKRLKAEGFLPFWEASKTNYRFWSKKGYLTLFVDPRPEAIVRGTMSWVTSCLSENELLEKLGDAWFLPVPRHPAVPRVYGFSQQTNGSYVVRDVGTLTDPFFPENYTPEVVSKFDYICAELSKPEPRGRLVLLEGIPGTGKTRLVRALVAALLDKSTCILVPPSLLDGISGPAFLDCLIQNHSQGKILTLILEDADDCLIARERNTGAKASLSALLNLSDGILGATLDLRIVATTNQKLDAIDPAILRPGRMLQRISIEHLGAEQANSIFQRLVGAPNPQPYVGPTILAQVYEDAKMAQDQWHKIL